MAKSLIAPVGLDIPFSNGQDIDIYQITDFTVFNDYIHYDVPTDISGSEFIKIPYLSTYIASSGWDPYPISSGTI